MQKEREIERDIGKRLRRLKSCYFTAYMSPLSGEKGLDAVIITWKI